jgi:hypothetical protein
MAVTTYWQAIIVRLSSSRKPASQLMGCWARMARAILRTTSPGVSASARAFPEGMACPCWQQRTAASLSSSTEPGRASAATAWLSTFSYSSRSTSMALTLRTKPCRQEARCVTFR